MITCDDPDCLVCHPLDGPAVPIDVFLAGYRQGRAALTRRRAADSPP